MRRFNLNICNTKIIFNFSKLTFYKSEEARSGKAAAKKTLFQKRNRVKRLKYAKVLKHSNENYG